VQYDRTVIGYHGCSAETAELILAGGEFKPSENEFDWLGRGIYFWEYGLDRAWRWAQEHTENPGVIGAVIQLGNCFDLLDTRCTTLLARTARIYVEGVKAAGGTLPQNGGKDRKARRLDCAIVNFALDCFRDEGVTYQCVRCGFFEGGPIFDDGAGCRTELSMETHIQIAVRDPACIVGTFRPTGRLAQ
jgi:hypothetical protein